MTKGPGVHGSAGRCLIRTNSSMYPHKVSPRPDSTRLVLFASPTPPPTSDSPNRVNLRVRYEPRKLKKRKQSLRTRATKVFKKKNHGNERSGADGVDDSETRDQTTATIRTPRFSSPAPRPAPSAWPNAVTTTMTTTTTTTTSTRTESSPSTTTTTQMKTWTWKPLRCDTGERAGGKTEGPPRTPPRTPPRNWCRRTSGCVISSTTSGSTAGSRRCSRF